MKRTDLTNQRYGKILVIEPSSEWNRDSVMWKCHCDCGNKVEITKRKLVTESENPVTPTTEPRWNPCDSNAVLLCDSIK